MGPRVGPVQRTHDGKGNFAGSGFVVYGNDGMPAVSFGFLKEADANVAAKKMSEIIAMCQDVSRVG